MMELEDELLQYHSEDARLKTFKKWPHIKGSCAPDKMANAGFFAEGPNLDSARCFVCLKSLEGWEPEDDPWEEHKNHSPNCAFLGLRGKTLTLADHIDLAYERSRKQLVIAYEKKCENLMKLAESARKVIKDLQRRKK